MCVPSQSATNAKRRSLEAENEHSVQHERYYDRCVDCILAHKQKLIGVLFDAQASKRLVASLNAPKLLVVLVSTDDLVANGKGAELSVILFYLLGTAVTY